MRSRAILCAATATLVIAAAATAEAPERPRGNFGGGVLVAPPRDIFGAGNAVVALRALKEDRLEIEATVRARCTGGDITAAVKVADDRTFRAEGTETQQPRGGDKVRTTYRLAGTFTSANAVEGTISATLRRSGDGETETCKTGRISFGARRADGRLGKRGAERRARYYGTTAQRGVGPRRPIVLRVSGDGKRISRALFGYHARCSDGTRTTGIEAPRTEIKIGRTGRVSDRDSGRVQSGGTTTHYDDRFTAVLGRRGAKGTLSLSDRTLDKATGNVIRSCSTGEVKWKAAP